MIWNTPKRGRKNERNCRKETKHYPTMIQDWRFDKQVCTAPTCHKTIANPANGRVFLSRQNSTLHADRGLTCPRPSPLMQISMKTVNFIDKFRLETNIESSIYNSDRWLPRISSDWLYYKSNPGLLGRHRMDITKHGMTRLKRELSPRVERPVHQLGWTSASENGNEADRSTSSDSGGINRIMMPILVEQPAGIRSQWKDDRKDVTSDWYINGCSPRVSELTNQSDNHPKTTQHVKAFPPGKPPLYKDPSTTRRVTATLNRKRNLRFKKNKITSRRNCAPVVSDEKIAAARQFRMEIDEANTPKTGRGYQREPLTVKKPNQLPPVSKHRRDSRGPERSGPDRRQVDAMSTGVSVWGYRQILVPSLGKDVLPCQNEFLITESRPPATSPATPPSGARSHWINLGQYENCLKPWTPMRIVSDATGDRHTPFCFAPAHRCPAISDRVRSSVDSQII
ncbi:hypothetical protein LSH36_104g01024 [Paralvinella palmiformis]|uniref:Uncharacterized protein n=1 Tax=Paralvinella palmiformis TaxID=53620 RepID=A0AAD9JZF3_9ANNE|nr:hypothetical protein LSH36_104g01024 [Paralvinella palmiformis]